MKQLVSRAVILSRTDFGEADRIISVLTPDRGKLRLIAKGVRKVKSRLAGGIELFSVSQITYIEGRKEIGTLISARLDKHYGGIVKAIDRTMLGYDLIKRLDRATEDQPEREYFDLLQQTFEALEDPAISTDMINLWFAMQLLRLGGHEPNLRTDTAGIKLEQDASYSFSFDDMAFARASSTGRFGANHIKFLRLGFGGHQARVLAQVQGSDELAEAVAPLVQAMLQTYIRL